LRKMTASSAYIAVLNLAARPFSLLSKPVSVAFCRRRLRGSMARMKRRGDKGSPCRSPLPCWIGCSGTPLSITVEVEEERSDVIQLIHLVGNPLCAN
jgi:hypothetical protein